MQQLVIGGGHNSSGHSQEGLIPRLKMKPDHHQNQIRTKLCHLSFHKGTIKKWILLRTRHQSLGIAKSKVKWKP